MLRKAHKRLRKGSSNAANRKPWQEVEEDDSEVIVHYLALINDFIKANISEEMTDFIAAKLSPTEPTEPLPELSPETPSPEI